MISTILTATIVCGNATLVNKTEEAWTKFDRATMKTAQKRCIEKYQNSPCLKKFTKTQPRSYQVVCGAGKKK